MQLTKRINRYPAGYTIFIACINYAFSSVMIINLLRVFDINQIM